MYIIYQFFFCLQQSYISTIQHFYRIDYIQTQGCQFITWTTYRYSVKHQNESTSSHKKIWNILIQKENLDYIFLW